ncbi:hypothetical protein LTR85_005903 [Meristemomyces frigidus]|nr:hypothetical protein LTR85_005903 [Meristemomyces frigidus]
MAPSLQRPLLIICIILISVSLLLLIFAVLAARWSYLNSQRTSSLLQKIDGLVRTEAAGATDEETANASDEQDDQATESRPASPHDGHTHHTPTLPERPRHPRGTPPPRPNGIQPRPPINGHTNDDPYLDADNSSLASYGSVIHTQTFHQLRGGPGGPSFGVSARGGHDDRDEYEMQELASPARSPRLRQRSSDLRHDYGGEPASDGHGR